MKIEGNRPASPARPLSGAQRVSAKSPAAPVGGMRRVEDSAEVLGIPDQELTPRVKAAISKLLDEVGDLRREIEAARRRVEELEQLADEDTLVKVYNRRAFVRELSRTRSFLERYGSHASLLYIDLNNFKEINDGFGHAAGDAALIHVAEILKKNVRNSDVVGRLGGDEFGVILNRAPRDQAVGRAEILARMIETRPARHDGRDLKLTISFGVCELSAGNDPEVALKDADKAMYEQKRGRSDKGAGK